MLALSRTRKIERTQEEEAEEETRTQTAVTTTTKKEDGKGCPTDPQQSAESN